MNRSDADPFLQGYLDAALFTTDPKPPSGCDYVESGRADEMFPRIPDDFIEQARKDCDEFTAANAALLEKAGDAWQNGADFWYTRNHHGVGFWDRGYPDDVADPLTEAAHKFGEIDLELTPDYPDQYLYVTECRSGESWTVPIGDDEPLDILLHVDKWIAETYGGEFIRDGNLMPKLDGDYYAEIMTDKRPPDSVVCWTAGGFYLKGANE